MDKSRTAENRMLSVTLKTTKIRSPAAFMKNKK